MMADRARPPRVATAADHRHARTMMQLLLSAERQGEHRHAEWEVYDLGLTEADRGLLSTRFPWASLKPFPLSDAPSHDAVVVGSEAGRPLLIAEAAKSFDGPLFWFDPGTILKAPLDQALRSLEGQGFWGLRSQVPLTRNCDPRVLEALGVPLEVRHIREYAAGAVGFDLATGLGRELVEDWARLSLIEDHIADQALLSSLLAKAMFAGRLEPTPEEIDIGSANPSPLVSTRNNVPSGRPLWADPLYRARSATRKAGIQLYHKARLFDDTRLDGLNRRRKDHFTVKLRQFPGGRETIVPGPTDGYYADPFITQRDGTLWLFMEEFVYPKDRGFLTVVGLDENLNVTSTEPVDFLPGYAALDSHASFPCIFEMDGEWFMIPETHERRAIDLYVCDRWPGRWRLRRRLRFGVDAADSMVVRHDGLWYLITSVKGTAPNRHLEIHYTDDMFSGRFLPHPVNNRNVYGNNANGTGRNAGFIQKQPDGTLLRLMQDSPNYYGEGIRPMRVTVLTPTEFREEPVDSIEFLPGIIAGFATHHATRSGDILAFDTRDRVG